MRRTPLAAMLTIAAVLMSSLATAGCAGVVERRYHRGAPCGPRAPGEAQRAVEGHVERLVGVEQQRSAGRVLADRGHAAVADDRVAAGERLHVALAGRQQGRVAVREDRDEARLARARVDPDAHGARLAVDGRIGSVVEEREVSA